MLKHGENSIVNSKGRWDPKDGDIHRPIWSFPQTQIFMDLRATLFKFIKGNHALTRSSVLKVYHPHLSATPGRLDQSKIFLTALFGTNMEHILFFRGEANDELYRDTASSILGEGEEPPKIPIKLRLKRRGKEICWECGPDSTQQSMNGAYCQKHKKLVPAPARDLVEVTRPITLDRQEETHPEHSAIRPQDQE